jgi:hypothetical protein
MVTRKATWQELLISPLEGEMAGRPEGGARLLPCEVGRP